LCRNKVVADVIKMRSYWKRVETIPDMSGSLIKEIDAETHGQGQLCDDIGRD
jgi:hypothetical protein